MATPARHFPSFGGRSPGNPPSRLFLTFPHPRNRAGACPDPGCTCRLAPELAPPNLDVQVPGSPPTHCFYFNYTPAAPPCPHLGAGRRTVAHPDNHPAGQLAASPTPRRVNAGPHQARGGAKRNAALSVTLAAQALNSIINVSPPSWGSGGVGSAGSLITPPTKKTRRQALVSCKDHISKRNTYNGLSGRRMCGPSRSMRG